jgi:hypothetical protein
MHLTVTLTLLLCRIMLRTVTVYEFTHSDSHWYGHHAHASCTQSVQTMKLGLSYSRTSAL